jgi:predicted DNA-binding transcriptional regulator AlpA
MTKRMVPYPTGTAEYLKTTYGMAPYSRRHMDHLISQKRFPRPVRITERRQASIVEELDQWVADVIAANSPEAA